MSDTYLSTAAAAHVTGYSTGRLRALCKAGHVAGAVRMIDDSAGRLVWRIPAAWAETHKPRRVSTWAARRARQELAA